MKRGMWFAGRDTIEEMLFPDIGESWAVFKWVSENVYVRVANTGAQCKSNPAKRTARLIARLYNTRQDFMKKVVKK